MQRIKECLEVLQDWFTELCTDMYDDYTSFLASAEQVREEMKRRK